MEIRTNALLFPKTRNSGPVSAQAIVPFPRAVTRAVAAVTGYAATFENREDQHLGKLELDVAATVDPANNRQVIIDGSFGLRDWSGTWDNEYSGNIQFAILAELAAVSPPAAGEARGDLLITDAEVTQAIQHFRSALHLDTPNVFPDNSIRLVAAKPAGVRLWVDYDRNSGLPLIPSITGSLTVTDASGITTVIPPLNTVVPRRENAILRGEADHTLNFVIPEGLCTGTISITAKVWNSLDSSVFSTEFTRSLVFEPMTAVRVFAVGVNYTGPDVIAGMPVTAPTPTDIANLFATAELLYPIPQVTQTGYMTMDWDREMISDISKGCDKFGDLKDAVSDLRGSSTDIFYGVLNTGVNTGSVGGCGGSGGAGAGRVGSEVTAAHELAHVLGRKHAPCDNVTRCARPLNTDDEYPDYAGYDSDSIGEFGFDTRDGSLRLPSDAHDLMGYSGNRWVSPYLYKALMSRIPSTGGGADGGDASTALGVARQSLGVAAVSLRSVPPWRSKGDQSFERIPLPAPHLFTRFTIHRDRRVEWETAFHFLTGPQAMEGRATKFTLELRDSEGNVLLAECLRDDESSCGCGCGCGSNTWPRRFRPAIPYDPSAARLAILECDKVIHEQEIPAPPKVSIEARGEGEPSDPYLHVRWKGSQDGQAHLWYLLQWRDRFGVWRGVAPRTQEEAWDVPKSLWGHRGGRVALRVLASAAIATGVAEWEGVIEVKREKGSAPRRVRLGLRDVDPTAAGRTEIPPILRATLWSEEGTESASGFVAWYNGRGALLGRGTTLQLNALPLGVHAIRAHVSNAGDGDGEAHWLIERTREHRYFLHRGTITYPDPDCPQGDVTSTHEPRSDR